MKTRLLFVVLILFMGSVFAQSGAPQKIKYQAVVRDNSGAPVVNNLNIRMQVTIYQYAATAALGGLAIYAERHTLQSNAFGLVNFSIGDGDVQSGQFDTIPWAEGPYFVKLEMNIDNTGWTNMTELSTVELMSVPYALYAEKSGSSESSAGDKVNLSHLRDRTIPFYDSIDTKQLQNSKMYQSPNNDTIAADAHISTRKTIRFGTEYPAVMSATNNGSFGIGQNISVENIDSDPLDPLHSVFAIGKENVLKSKHAFGIGIGNEISEAEDVTIVGIDNSVINDPVVAMPAYVNVFGKNNKIESSEDLTVLGQDNVIDESTNESMILGGKNTTKSFTGLTILGRDNNITGGTSALVLGDNNVLTNGSSTIVVGKGNRADNNQTGNILIGLENTPNVNNNIVIGQKNRPSINSIFIGTGNQGGDDKNIVIGADNRLDGNPLTDNSIAIGNNIGKNISAGYSFAISKSISIGNNITPYSVGGSNSSADKAISIGDEIQTTADYSISIGTNIQTGGPNASPRVGYSVNIGNNIRNTRIGCIVLGQNNEGLYAAANNLAYQPKFVVGINSSGSTPVQHHLLLITEEAKAFFGVSGFSGITPGFAANSAVYARMYNGYSGATSFTIASDKRLKSNIKPLMSEYSDYLHKIRPFSFHYTNDKSQRLEWGFMAQDIQNYFPHLVVESEDGTLSLGYLGFIPILWKIAQEQRTQIDEQQMRIEELERKVDLLLQKIGE